MGHLNSFLASGGGNLNKNFPKVQMPDDRIAGADPGEVKQVNFHPPFSEPTSFFFSLSLKY